MEVLPFHKVHSAFSCHNHWTRTKYKYLVLVSNPVSRPINPIISPSIVLMLESVNFHTDHNSVLFYTILDWMLSGSLQRYYDVIHIIYAIMQYFLKHFVQNVIWSGLKWNWKIHFVIFKFLLAIYQMKNMILLFIKK